MNYITEKEEMNNYNLQQDIKDFRKELIRLFEVFEKRLDKIVKQPKGCEQENTQSKANVQEVNQRSNSK